MKLTFAPGESLLRITLRTGANFGAGEAPAPVDRPVALDAWTGLPYLPWSALKGVVAGEYGDVVDPADGSLNGRRAAIFGSPDRPGEDGVRPGGPGRLRFGDGELLCFPLRLRTGRTATVFALDELVRLQRLGFGSGPSFRSKIDESCWDGAPAGEDLRPTPDPLSRRAMDVPVAELAALSGAAPRLPLYAAGGAAERFWQQAVERRTLTALANGRVVRGSLRRVELVPAGTTFVSLVTNAGPGPVDLEISHRLQVGAWEAIGAGFVSLEVVTADHLRRPSEEPASRGAGDAAEGAASTLAEHRIMTKVHAAVQELASRPEARNVRTIVRELGPRWQAQGLPRTLAFCAAKAVLGEAAAKTRERRAYRWVLAHLLVGEEADREALAAEVRAIAGGKVEPVELEPRVRWLRRYAEVLLPRHGAAGPDGGAAP